MTLLLRGRPSLVVPRTDSPILIRVWMPCCRLLSRARGPCHHEVLPVPRMMSSRPLSCIWLQRPNNHYFQMKSPSVDADGVFYFIERGRCTNFAWRCFLITKITAVAPM